jgi:hypothetical protein
MQQRRTYKALVDKSRNATSFAVYPAYVTQQTQIDWPSRRVGKEGLNLELSMSQAKVGHSCEGSIHLDSRGAGNQYSTISEIFQGSKF